MTISQKAEPRRKAEPKSRSAKKDKDSPLRVAAVVASVTNLATWEKIALSRLCDEPAIQIVGLIEWPGRPDRRSGMAFALVNRLDAALFARETDFQSASLDAAITQCPKITITEAAEDDVAVLSRAVEAWKPDLILNWTRSQLPLSLVGATRFGEWSFNFTSQQDEFSDWHGYNAIISGSDVTEVELLALDGSGSTSQVATAAFSSKISGAKGGRFFRQNASALLVRELRRLSASRKLSRPRVPAAKSLAPPTASETARYALKLGQKCVKRAGYHLISRLGKETNCWRLYMGAGNIVDFDVSKAKEILAGHSHKADPFLFTHEGSTYLFYEEYFPGTKGAHIAAARLEGDDFQPIGIALKPPHHVSFPYVFRHGKDIFMLPETQSARRMEIWRSTEFPLKWELYATGFEGKLTADSVMFPHDDNWWLFTNLSDYHGMQDHSNQLHIFQVDGPRLREIIPHRYNPVIIGSATARNAGRIFKTGKRLFRPSQSTRYGIYGYGLNIAEVTRLSLDDYEERIDKTVEPDFVPNQLGCHHIDSEMGRFVIDARVWL